MDQLRLPLLLISESLTSGRVEPLSQFRMQKGVYMLQQEGPPTWSAFTFRESDWGPYSGALDRTLWILLEQGLMEKVHTSLTSCYRNSEAGEDFVAPFVAQLDEQHRELVRGIRIVATSAILRV